MNKIDKDGINQLIDTNQSFAIWREPNDSVFHFVMQDAKKALLCSHDISDFDSIEGFVIAPFDLAKHPAVIIQTDYTEYPIKKESTDTRAMNLHGDSCLTSKIETDLSRDEDFMEDTVDDNFSDFTRTFKLVKQSLKEGIDKIVLAHQFIYNRPDSFSPAEVFFRACSQHPSAYVHLSNTPISGTWIGATPELLLDSEANSSEYHTMALAGTQLISSHDDIDTWNEQDISLHWDAKNVKEHKIVSKFISDKLMAYQGIESFRQLKPRTVRAGHLAHLQTQFDFRLPPNSSIGNLAMTLYPTPAVCGMPQAAANEAIKRAEQLDRGYYAGFVGYKGASRCQFMVNLRCMNIQAHEIRLWAGGGILPSSKLENEFREVELKKQIMRQLW